MSSLSTLRYMRWGFVDMCRMHGGAVREVFQAHSWVLGVAFAEIYVLGRMAKDMTTFEKTDCIFVCGRRLQLTNEDANTRSCSTPHCFTPITVDQPCVIVQHSKLETHLPNLKYTGTGHTKGTPATGGRRTSTSTPSFSSARSTWETGKQLSPANSARCAYMSTERFSC